MDFTSERNTYLKLSIWVQCCWDSLECQKLILGVNFHYRLNASPEGYLFKANYIQLHSKKDISFEICWTLKEEYFNCIHGKTYARRTASVISVSLAIRVPNTMALAMAARMVWCTPGGQFRNYPISSWWKSWILNLPWLTAVIVSVPKSPGRFVFHTAVGKIEEIRSKVKSERVIKYR